MRDLTVALALFVTLGLPGSGVYADAGQNLPKSWPKESGEVAALRPRAERGEAEAQYRLGMALLVSHGVDIDVPKGVSWIRRAAEQECPNALNPYNLTARLAA